MRTGHYLIVGGAGFLGSHLIPRLLDEGCTVTVVDIIAPDNARRLSPYIEKIRYLWKSALDLTDQDFSNVDVVVYLAAQADVPLAITSPRYTFQQNIMELVSVLEVLRGLQDVKFIYLSSENVYGAVPADRIPIVEDEPLRPVDPYGASKAASDLTVQSYARAYGMTNIVLRSASLFGPGLRLRQVIPIFIRQALANKPITIEGDGAQSRDFNYVGNLVEAILLASDAGRADVYNVACGEELTILQLAKKILNATNSSSEIVFKPWRAGDRGLRLILSNQKASSVLGYVPKFSFDYGLRETIEWLRGSG